MKEFIRKNIANFFSCIRIVGAVILLIFFSEFSKEFLILYAICCSTDAIDGFLARKLNTCSVLGVTLDTIGDLLIGITPVKVLIVQKEIEGWFLIWIGVSILFFLISAIISQIKFKKFSFPHTYFDKLLGCCVAASPFIYVLSPSVDILFIIVGTVFSIASIESVIIQLRVKEAKSFVPSIFHTNK